MGWYEMDFHKDEIVITTKSTKGETLAKNVLARAQALGRGYTKNVRVVMLGDDKPS